MSYGMIFELDTGKSDSYAYTHAKKLLKKKKDRNILDNSALILIGVWVIII